MKDLLTEKVKLETKILDMNLLQDYYKAKITWIQYKEQIGKVNAAGKAILEEADVKPTFRNELELFDFPLTEWLKRQQHKK